jgi:hypothetical protein
VELSMDERIEKAFETANYMATLSNQRRIILEEFNQQLIYYINGAVFKIDSTLISYIKTVLDLGHTTDIVFVDSNNSPVQIQDVQEFFDTVTEQYFLALNSYSNKYTEIKKQRRIQGLIEL